MLYKFKYQYKSEYKFNTLTFIVYLPYFSINKAILTTIWGIPSPVIGSSSKWTAKVLVTGGCRPINNEVVSIRLTRDSRLSSCAKPTTLCHLTYSSKWQIFKLKAIIYLIFMCNNSLYFFQKLSKYWIQEYFW